MPRRSQRHKTEPEPVSEEEYVNCESDFDDPLDPDWLPDSDNNTSDDEYEREFDELCDLYDELKVTKEEYSVARILCDIRQREMSSISNKQKSLCGNCGGVPLILCRAGICMK